MDPKQPIKYEQTTTQQNNKQIITKLTWILPVHVDGSMNVRRKNNVRIKKQIIFLLD